MFQVLIGNLYSISMTQQLFNNYPCHWSPLASQGQASREQVHLQLLERQKKNREFMPALAQKLNSDS
uniref:Uncharacterized protein n=1 Tax=Zea mays TaxID=4577 RepID=B7ZY56_MAIZE|nr:unknown [Zea mays]